jgi:transmembrane sensor
MKPGEQATLGKLLTVHPVDVADAIAWKNGVTSYNEANIKTIMRQVSRWYDVNVNYEGQVPDRYFTGSISRNSKLSELLKIFDLSDIHYTLKDHLITIKP